MVGALVTHPRAVTQKNVLITKSLMRAIDMVQLGYVDHHGEIEHASPI